MYSHNLNHIIFYFLWSFEDRFFVFRGKTEQESMKNSSTFLLEPRGTVQVENEIISLKPRIELDEKLISMKPRIKRERSKLSVLEEKIHVKSRAWFVCREPQDSPVAWNEIIKRNNKKRQELLLAR